MQLESLCCVVFRFRVKFPGEHLAYVLLKFTIITGARAIFATINDAIITFVLNMIGRTVNALNINVINTI